MLKRSSSRVSIEDGDRITLDRVDIQKLRQSSDVEYSTDCESNRGGTFTPTVTLTSDSYTHCSEYVRPILVGYAFGKKKMSTMGMIMAEASMEISTIIHTENNDEYDKEAPHKIQETSSIRVSFVPLDLDIPIHEQHGGQFDVILHKLTEDILSCRNKSAHCSAQDRIQSLSLYKQDRPACCLVDHPEHILPVLGRDHMCNILKSCLVDVKTTSGLRVSTPQYLVLKHSLGQSIIQEQLSKVPITYPVIVKPLAAAGTVQSHKMSILFAENALNRICGSVLLQQYTNHDSLLYKVYVLGDTVWVFPRNSLPNLPTGDELQNTHSSYVEFDSQKPYPDLSAFCQIPRVHKKPKIKHIKSITSQEVQPVVETLRKSFQLELFGFDVLVHTDGNEIMVVDVNYFPSYKEVLNFPKYLARYLTKRAIDARKQR